MIGPDPFPLPDPDATAALGVRLAGDLAPGRPLLLWGPLGIGKTHLARALIRAWVGEPALVVPSPTFTLVQLYARPDGAELWHCDLYRLAGPDEVPELGLDEAFPAACVVVEWPERLGPDLPVPRLDLTLAPGDAAGTRVARLARTG